MHSPLTIFLSRGLHREDLDHPIPSAADRSGVPRAVPGLENGATFTYDDLRPGVHPTVHDLPDDQCVEGTATARLTDGREFVYTGPMCPATVGP